MGGVQHLLRHQFQFVRVVGQVGGDPEQISEATKPNNDLHPLRFGIPQARNFYVGLGAVRLPVEGGHCTSTGPIDGGIHGDVGTGRLGVDGDGAGHCDLVGATDGHQAGQNPSQNSA